MPWRTRTRTRPPRSRSPCASLEAGGRSLSGMRTRIAHQRIAVNAKRCLRLSPLAIDPGVELRQLATFVAVAEEGSFTRAADRLHIVHSAVSAGVRNLEK